MPEAWLLYGLLGLICACLVVMTATALVLVNDLRRTLRQINVFVKRSGQVVTGARRIIARADVTAGRVNRIVSHACAAAESALGGLTGLKKRAGSIATKWLGNGAGEEPRSRYRS